MDIHRIMRVRAQMAATVEYLKGMTPAGDPEEREEHKKALATAIDSYRQIEALFSTATSTLSDSELAELEAMIAA